MKLWTLMLACIAISFTACGSKKGSESAPVTNAYYLSNSVCYERSTNKSVTRSKCDNVPYYFKNKKCYDYTTKNQVDMANCYAQVERYFMYNSECYDKTNDEEVSDSKCENVGDDDERYVWKGDDCWDNENDENTYPQLCDGETPEISCRNKKYYYYQNGEKTSITCNSQKNYCSGKTVYDGSDNKLLCK